MNAAGVKYRFRLALMLFAAGAVVPVLHAQDADDLQRGVARISVMDGEVSVRRGDSGEWVAGVINAPLMSDDHVATGPNSRAEVQLDGANVLRLGANAELHLTQLEAARFQMELARGTVTYNVLRESGIDVEVDTPNVSVRPLKQGVYRIQVNDAGETQVISRAAEVEVFTPRGSQWVATGQMMMARGNQSDPEFQMVSAPGLDEWDRWNESRDHSITQSTSNQYVGPGVYGVEDLDTTGTWQNVAPYGYSWSPNGVAADWAPYSTGRWVWEDWYGWTWVSYEPWGWAPYHYGRWFWGSNRWWWYPGSIGARHYWSPALVAFFGFGGGGGVGFAFGNVGWVPLAPYEVLHPWWGRGYYGRRDYFNRGINVTNVNVTNIYRNARVGRGISGLPSGDFRSGRFGNVSRFSGDQVRQAGLIRGAVPLAPTRDNLRFSDRGVSNIPRTTANRQFFTRQQPNRVDRVPFSQVGEGVRSTADVRGNGGLNRPDGRGSVVAGRDTVRPDANGRQSQAPGATGGWRRFGEPAAGQSGASQSRPADRGASNNFRGNTPQPGGASGSPQGRFENMRPQQLQAAPSQDRSVQNRGGWSRFGESGNSPQQSYAPSSRGIGNGRRDSGNFNSAPRQSPPESPRYSAPGNSAPRYSQPAQRYNPPANSGGGSYNRSQPQGRSYQAPPQRTMPQYSAPRHESPRGFGGGGGGNAAPRSFGGGGGGGAPRSSGGGGGSRPSGGGGGGHSGGNGGHGRR